MADEEQTKSLATSVFEAFGQDVPPEYQDMKVEADTATEQGADPQTGSDSERARDENGRFSKQEDTDADKQPEEAKSGEGEDAGAEGGKEAENTEAPADESADHRPPPGWSPTSKAEWDKLPATVKADIAKREREVSDGFSQYKGMKELVPYQEHYSRTGASLKQVLDGYIGLDNALQKDFTGGLAAICQKASVNPVHAAYAILQRAGVQIPQSQDEGKDGQKPAQAPRQTGDPRVDQILDYLAQDKKQREAIEERTANQTLEQFANDPKHTFFDNVKVTMGQLIQTGQATNLEDAYEKACWSNPEIRDLLIRQREAEKSAGHQGQRRAEAAAQARDSARGITGSPTPGARSGGSGAKPKMTDREAIAQAMAEQGIAV